jgi:sulfatase modifying factor 1
VTQEQWQAVMGKNPAVRKGKKLPVENVRWLDCQEFLQKMGKKDGRAYRLPTEAEWEYACRAGTTTAFSFGETISTQQANYDGVAYGAGKRGTARKKTTPVDTFPPNKWGLRDMHGNVYNWCADWYGPYPTGDVVDPKGPATEGDRVMRGGSFVSNPPNLRSACRHPYAPIYATYNVGFRVAL